MGRARSRKVPITKTTPTDPSTSSSNTRSVIRRFHVLLKTRSRAKHDPKKLAEIDAEIEQLGGLDAYQQMSKLGQRADRGGGTEKVFIDWLKHLGLRGQSKLKLLEVGALKPDNYHFCLSWIDNTPIDLHSQHPDILEQDFLEMSENENSSKWDLISLSLVLNFVPGTEDRGRMLRLSHTMLKPNGLLFLALPLPCVQNSRYLTLEHLNSLMRHAGFDQVEERWKVDGKMAYWLYRKTEPAVSSGLFDKKVVMRSGKHRNNFAITL